MKYLEKTINSLEISGMVGREHKEVLRDIRNIISQLAGSKIALGDYFTETTYLDANKQERPCYDCTKKGCELYSTRMTGAKGTQFAAAYIERFNQMETQIKAPSSTKVLLQASLEHEERLEVLEGEVETLKAETTLTPNQKKRIRSIVNKTVIRYLGGMRSAAYKDKSLRSTAYASCYKQLRNVYEVASYEEIPKIKFEEAMSIIPKWTPVLELQTKIDFRNGTNNIWNAG